MGIAIACLVEDEKTHLIDWVKEVGLSDLPSLDLLLHNLIGALGDNIPEETYHRGNRQS